MAEESALCSNFRIVGTHSRRIFMALTISAAPILAFAQSPAGELMSPPLSEPAPPPLGELEAPPLAEPEDSSLRYTEDDFHRKASVEVAYSFSLEGNLLQQSSVIGSRRFYTAHEGDTFLDIARFYGLGYNEIEQANRGVDPWLPDRVRSILLPTEWVLPVSGGVGVVVNIPEMRLYYFFTEGGESKVSTYPVGLGRDDWRTPSGAFKIQGKTENPRWVIPESIRAERIREKGLHETFIAGGDPRNPLGKHRLELTLPGYRIHGTNKTYGVGMQVSHGCVRLYPEDIERLFSAVRVGSPGEFIYQPVKVGARAGRIYVEVHRDIYTLIPGLYGEATRLLRERGWIAYVDQKKLEKAVEEQTGVPVDITTRSLRGPKPGADSPASDQPPRSL